MSHKRNKNRKHHAHRPRRVPPTMADLRIRVRDDESLRVTLDGKPYEVQEHWEELGRDAVPRIIDRVAVEHGPTRVQITETDGNVFTDIATPPDFADVASAPLPARGGGGGMFELIGVGFRPNEAVGVAVIVHTVSADREGYATLNLPPSLLSAIGKEIVMVGWSSSTACLVHTP